MIPAFVCDTLPARVVFGPGSIDEVADETAALGLERVLVVASPANAEVGARVAAALGARCAGSFGEVAQHVPEQLADAACGAARDAAADGLVTIGGGSATGLGKAVALTLGVPIVAVPTTYAGSEMTPIYGITGERKRTGRDRRVQPRTVVYDPELTLGLPPAATATTGMNALAHAIEALYAPGANPVSSLLADEASKVLIRALPAAVASPHDLDARTEALYGAFLAGAALAGAGTALHHKLCHVLGGSFRLAHGDVNAVVLPHVVAYNQPAVGNGLSSVGAALGTDDVADGLYRLARRIGAPADLGSLGLPATALDAVADQIVEVVGDANPREVDVSSLAELLKDAYLGHAPRSWNR